MNSYSKKLEDGRYVYYAWDEDAKRHVPHYLMAGENGVTEEIIVTLEDFDHDAYLVDRYAEENTDYRYRNYLTKSANGEAGVKNPLDEQACEHWRSPNRPTGYSDEVDLVRSLLDSLTKEQVDLIYAIFGEMRTQKEIAIENGNKYPQAVAKRLDRIKKRLKKLLDNRGFER